MATTMCSEPNSTAALSTSLGSRTAALLMLTRSAPASRASSTSRRDFTPPPRVRGTLATFATLRNTSSIVFRFSTVAVMSRKPSSSAPCSQ